MQTAADGAGMGPPRIMFGMAPTRNGLYIFGGSMGMAASPLKLVQSLSLNDLYQVIWYQM
jgi:hypothetical protein